MMKIFFTSIRLSRFNSLCYRGKRKQILNTRLIILFLLIFTMLLPAQSESIQKAIDTYKKNFYVWKEPEATQPTTDSVLTVLGRWAWGPCNAVDAKGNFAYIDNGPTFQILDISDPTSPGIVGEYLTEGIICDIEVRGSDAFVGTGNGLYILNITDPSAPEEISFIDISGVPISLAIEDSFAYVTTSSGYMKVIDISSLNTPYLRGIISASGELATSIEAKDGFVYIGNLEWPLMKIVNATNPDTLTSTWFDVDGIGTSCFIKDTLLFISVSYYSTYFKIYDISDLAIPVLVGQVETEDSIIIDGVTVSEDGLNAYTLGLLLAHQL